MEEHRASIQTYKKVHKETVKSELRMEIVQQSMEMDMWEIKDKLAERRELMKVTSRDFRNKNNSMAEIQFVEDSTKPLTTEKSSEDGDNLEELMLIDDLDKPLMVLESDGMINKNEFVPAIILKLGCEICLGHLLTNVRLKQNQNLLKEEHGIPEFLNMTASLTFQGSNTQSGGLWSGGLDPEKKGANCDQHSHDQRARSGGL
ncbi:hypothetical protein Tco_1151451 [Tanacetum coccineum]